MPEGRDLSLLGSCLSCLLIWGLVYFFLPLPRNDGKEWQLVNDSHRALIADDGHPPTLHSVM